MTAPHYGKRRAGLLTAASPGDTLYFQYGSYNDSGDSEAQSGFAVTDVEIFKNGIAVARATDSGYSLISDTGQMGDRVGLNRFSVQLFNTSDDTGFYDNGGWYQVAVDSVTIDGKTVRMWVGSFEIGEPRANVIQIDGDTGPADNLGRIAGDTGTGSYIYRESDTGGIADAIWAKDVRALTAFALDTGIAQTVWRSSPSSFTSDTGSAGYAQGRLMAVRNDTGAAHLDQGRLGANVVQVRGDTGAAQHVAQAFAAQNTNSDTGLIANAAAVRVQTDKLVFTVANQVDVNIQSVNDVTVTGTGTSGDPWGP